MPKTAAIDRAVLSVAGEFAVALELCRRNIYAQPTFGNQKRTDLLILNELGQMWCVEVKSKQAKDWPQCRGISNKNYFLILVDFEGKLATDRPDFYILSYEDWRSLCECKLKSYHAKHPNRRAIITEDCFIRLLDERNKAGKPYEGTGVQVNDVLRHKDAWQKIAAVVGPARHVE